VVVTAHLSGLVWFEGPVEPTKGDFYERPESSESVRLEDSPVLSGPEETSARPKGFLSV
jgi:hypothetical protein